MLPGTRDMPVIGYAIWLHVAILAILAKLRFESRPKICDVSQTSAVDSDAVSTFCSLTKTYTLQVFLNCMQVKMYHFKKFYSSILGL